MFLGLLLHRLTVVGMNKPVVAWAMELGAFPVRGISAEEGLVSPPLAFVPPFGTAESGSLGRGGNGLACDSGWGGECCLWMGFVMDFGRNTIHMAERVLHVETRPPADARSVVRRRKTPLFQQGGLPLVHVLFQKVTRRHPLGQQHGLQSVPP